MLSDSKKCRNSHYKAIGQAALCWQSSSMKSCIVCQAELSGRQTRFCSRRCKNGHNNNRHQSYRAQQTRGRKRKLAIVSLKGMQCERCGYARNFSALEFHHIEPNLKEFHLDLRSLSNRKWSVILEEVAKCILVCSNCHKEIHHPDAALGQSSIRNGVTDKINATQQVGLEPTTKRL